MLTNLRVWQLTWDIITSTTQTQQCLIADWVTQRRVYVRVCTMRSSLIGYQVTWRLNKMVGYFPNRICMFYSCKRVEKKNFLREKEQKRELQKKRKKERLDIFCYKILGGIICFSNYLFQVSPLPATPAGIRYTQKTKLSHITHFPYQPPPPPLWLLSGTSLLEL